MRTGLIGLVAAVMLVSAGPVYAAEGIAQDTIIDQVGDWFATVGKPGADKDAILVKRRAERLAKRAQHAANKQAKHASQQANKAGKELKQGLQGLGN